MPAFTAVAAYIVANVGGIALAAAVGSAGITLITSVVATGLAALTARIINGGGSTGGAGGTQQDPGVRIQLPPATDNKVPVIYGTANTKGICVDARISSDNQQMTYVLVLGEKTQTGTFTVGDIYWNDQLLIFDTGSNNYKVASSTDQNGLGTNNTNLAGLVELRVFAGSAQTSGNQIFPTTNKVSAASYIGESTSTYLMSDLVYAVVKLNYSSEKGVTSLAQMTFEVSNSLSNPGLVLYDYLTSPRYGVGISATQIDTASMTNTVTNTSLYSISNEIPPNQFESNGTTSTQARYVINGVLSTGATNKSNLEKITLACSSWLTYDFVQGKWSVIVNRALSVSELASVITYDDDSIMGEISVNATNLEDLFNAIEIEFPSREIRDQNDYYRAEIAQVDRNDLEPDNLLNLRYDLINNGIHAQRLGLIELLQSRVDKNIQFTTTYKGLQTSAGDVIKITNEVYGFNEKLFRVTRVREVEDEIGSITCEITALEYDADVYGDSSITDYQPNTASGIPSFGGPTSLPPPLVVNVGSTFPTNNNPYFAVSTSINPTSAPVDQILWYYRLTTSGPYTYVTNEVGPFDASATVSDTLAGLPAGGYYLYARSVKDGLYSDYSSDSLALTNYIDWNPQPGGVNDGSISTATFSSQIQVTNTTTGLYSLALTTGTGYQRVYGDVDITYSPSANTLNVGGGVQANRVVSSGGFPLNSAGTATMFAAGLSPSMVISNYTAGQLPQVAVRGYGQNRPGGGATTNPATSLYLEGARGTNTSPTALQLGDGYALVVAGGYDGLNWSGDTGQVNSFLGWYAAENWTNNGSTGTNNAGTGFQIWAQPSWARLGINQSRQRILNTNWTTSTVSPSQLNMNFGSGTDGTNPTIIASDGTSYTGYGRTNFNLLNANLGIFCVPAQDTAPDNASLTATTIMSFVSNRRSGTSGRRNPVQSGDDLGVIGFRGQHIPNATGIGLRGATIAARTLEAFTSTRAGTSIAISTVNSGTTTEQDRLFISDAAMRYRADTHTFADKTGSFTALTVSTATTTVSGTLNAPGTYHCEVARSSTTATATATDVIVYWNKTNSDPFGWLTNFTQVKPTVSGYYLVQGQINFEAGSGTGQINTQIRKNGSAFATSQDQQPATAAIGRTLNVSGIVQLNGSTDYIDMTTYSSSITGQNINGTADGAWTKLIVSKLQ